VAIVQKYRDGLPEPGGGEDQVNGMISVDVARFYPQASGRSDELHGLSPCSGELKLNPIGAGAGGVVSTLNAGQVRAMIAIEIGNGDR
jgi:hypothetical protein